jgi:hypothetical protein
MITAFSKTNNVVAIAAVQMLSLLQQFPKVLPNVVLEYR